ncbi:hypothetical protein J2T57_001474 [Natronocella acetinitrilica]|uniref:SH3 domain-containing protein n=1 Tax=Natronocella acetinitrilica TaxID=414046 RepID=A0AAE3G2S5_9GAMM|nr:hypothetical protein [Natronocella acetinitrilica]MCP1674372.1 hypothetical protein [Natronocella acetinitrilica]
MGMPKAGALPGSGSCSWSAQRARVLAGSDHPVAGSAERGEELLVQETRLANDGYRWHAVRAGARAGWVREDLIRLR